MEKKIKNSKITGIYLDKFQSIFNPTFIKLDKLTFVYGPNSAGKSSIIDALKILSNFAGINEPSDYYSFQGYSRRYSSNRSNYIQPMSIGIEYELGSSWSLRERDMENEWWSSPIPDLIDEYIHTELFVNLTGKKIQIQLGEEGNFFGVGVEGKPLFEIHLSYLYYDNFYKEIDRDDEKKIEFFSDNLLSGAVTFYKKNPFFDHLKNDINEFFYENARKANSDFNVIESSPFYKCLIKENEQAITIHGVVFDASRQWSGNNYVTGDIGLENMLFRKYEDLASNIDSFDDPVCYKQFLEEHVSSNKLFSQREQFKRGLEKITKILDKLIIGFRFNLSDVLIYSHVKGSRKTLNSDDCFYYEPDKILSIKSHMESDRNYMTSYAQNLFKNSFDNKNSNKFDQLAIWGKNSIPFDFTNQCLAKYFPSLRNYSIKALAGEIKLPDGHPSGWSHESKKDSPIYLCLEFQNKLYGFEDVGSGLSYIFPILTSLNAMQFSVVEQPELHLHPASQCELGDVFLSAQHFGSIALVESHSEHLLLRILRRIRETTEGFLLREELKATPSNLRIYYFDPNADGTTSVKEIRVDEFGELLNTWPGGFFSEREKELFSERNLRN